jgi:uncharacterized protein YecE (DUF72 family)
MASKNLHIGTSGWSYKHWRGLIYPQNVKAADWLAFYTRHFDSTEINRSFYLLPKPAVVTGWVATVPKNFVFCPKISRFLTHMKKLRDPTEPLQRFFNAFANLPARQFGPVLMQLPPMLGFKETTARPFYETLAHEWPRHSFALEVRHQSWLCDESIRLLKHYGVAWVISQSCGDFPYLEAVTSKHVYLRMHGPADLYASAYTDEQLKSYAKKIKSWQKNGHRVWVYFNNDIHGHAWRDALRLKALLGDTV